VIASDLGISERTVEVHRSQVMKKLDARTLAQLVRIHLQDE
jgi:FixJ family two-component response regulator